MNIDELWAEANAARPASLSPAQIRQAMITESASHVTELTTRLATQRDYAVGFAVAFVCLGVVLRDDGVAVASLTVATLLYFLGAVTLQRGVSGLHDFAPTHASARDRLEAQLALVRRTLRLNHVWGALSLPVMVGVGLVVGWSVSEGPSSLSDLLADGGFLRVSAITLAVVLPVAYLLGEWMTRVAFGRLTEELRVNLEALRRLETA